MPRAGLLLFLSTLPCTPVAAQQSAQDASPAATRAGPIEEWIAALGATKTWDRAAGKLVELGEPAVQPLAKALAAATGGKKELVVQRVLIVLERIGLAAQDATPAIWNALADLDTANATLGWRVACRIAPIGEPDVVVEMKKSIERTMFAAMARNNRRDFQALGASMNALAHRSKIDPKQGVDDLKTQLGPGKAGRIAICQLLGAKGKAARSAVPALLEVMKSGIQRTGRPSPRARRRRAGQVDEPTVLTRTAAEAILAIDPRCSEAAFAYGYLVLEDPIRALRVRAARELLMLGHHVERALPMLGRHLGKKSEDAELTLIVLNCLAMAGRKAADHAAAVEKLTSSDNAKVAARAKAVWKRIRRE